MLGVSARTLGFPPPLNALRAVSSPNASSPSFELALGDSQVGPRSTLPHSLLHGGLVYGLFSKHGFALLPNMAWQVFLVMFGLAFASHDLTFASP